MVRKIHFYSVWIGILVSMLYTSCSPQRSDEEVLYDELIDETQAVQAVQKFRAEVRTAEQQSDVLLKCHVCGCTKKTARQLAGMRCPSCRVGYMN